MEARALYEAQAEHRGTSQGLLIPQEEQYRERLDIAAGLIMRVEPTSVLDVGCGYADLVDLLPVGTIYLGIEMTAWVHQEAVRRHPGAMLLRARFEDLYGEGAFDVVALLGVLATTDPGAWAETAMRAKAMARKAVVVSWLESRRYRGRLVSGRDVDLVRMFGLPEAVVDIEGDATRTALFRVPAR